MVPDVGREIVATAEGRDANHDQGKGGKDEGANDLRAGFPSHSGLQPTAQLEVAHASDRTLALEPQLVAPKALFS